MKPNEAMAFEWLKERSERYLRDGKYRWGPNADLLILRIGGRFETVPTFDGSGQVSLLHTDSRGYQTLLKAALEDEECFELLNNVAAQWHLSGKPMPPQIFEFIPASLLGQIKPKARRRGHPYDKNWARNLLIFEMVSKLVCTFGFTDPKEIKESGRRDRSSKTAADLVSKALRETGIDEVIPRTVREIYLHRLSEMLNEAEAVTRPK
jgi:hypothetical protein